MQNTPFFILASPRSGTTLLERLLNGHSSVFVPPETAFFHHLKRLGFTDEGVTNLSLKKFVKTYLDTRAARLLNLGAPNLVAGILLAGARSYSDVFLNLLNLLCSGCGKPHLGEKTPHHLRCVDYIATCMSQVKFVCVVRDGRAVVRSHLKHPNWERNLLVAAKAWRDDANIIHRLLASEGAERVHLVSYERLLSNPEVELKEVCDFLGVDFEAAMLAHESMRSEIPSQHAEYYQQSWMAKSTTGLDTSRADAWRMEYSATELALVEQLVGSELRQFGYEVCARGVFWWRILWLKESVRHLAFRLNRYLKRKVSAGLTANNDVK